MFTHVLCHGLQRTNRQSGYGFVHFSADSAGIAAAFQAVSAVDNSTVDGVTYNVELSKNLLKQFNELQKGQAPTEDHAPVSRAGGMNPNAPAFNNNASNHWAGPGGSQNGPFPPSNKYAPAGQHHRGGSGGGGSGGPYPNAAGGMMYQQQHMGPPQHAGYPMGAPHAQQMRGLPQHGAVNPHNMHAYMNAPSGHSNNAMYASQNMPYGNPYGDPYQQSGPDPMDYLNAPHQAHLQGHLQSHLQGHQQGHLSAPGHMQGPYSSYRIGGSNVNPAGNFPPSHGNQQMDPRSGGGMPTSSLTSALTGISVSGSSLINNTNTSNVHQSNVHQSSVHNSSGHNSNCISPLASSPMPAPFDFEAERSSVFPLTSGGSANSPFPARSHSVSPVPGRSPRAEDSLHATGGHHSRQASGSIARSLTDSIIADGLLLNADNYSHPSHYSPRSNGAMSPMYESDSGHSGNNSLVGKPPPLNLSGLSGLTSHPHYSANNSIGGGGSSASSVRSGSSAGTSPIPTGRGGMLERLSAMNTTSGMRSSSNHYWESDANNPGLRVDKPPTPLGNKAVGAPTLTARSQGTLGASSASCSSGSTSQDSTPTNAYAKSMYGVPNSNSLSPKSGMSASNYPVGAGLSPGIGSALPPQAQASAPARSGGGMHSRSSSTSSATASTGLYTTSGNVSPSPYHQNATGHPTSITLSSSTSSGALNSARKPSGLSDLDLAYGINRSISSSASDRNLNTLSTHGTTDTEGTFFGGSASHNASFLQDNLSPSARREQAILASQIMLSNLTATPLTDDQLELHKQLYDLSLQQPLSPSSASGPVGGYFGQQGNHRNYRKDKSSESAPVASRPVLLQSAAKQISLQSVSSIGEDPDEDYEDNEFTYSSATSAAMTPKHLSNAGSFNLGDTGSFRLDTSFMHSPQSSDQSENSPFASYSSDNFRGRPPSGSSFSGLISSGMHSNTATVLSRRANQQMDSASSSVDEDGTDDAVAAYKDSRPVSLNSLNSNDSSQLAGIAISSDSTSSEWDGVQGGLLPLLPTMTALEKSSGRPEGVRMSKTATAAVAAAGVCAEKTDAVPDDGKPKSRQLSLTQFFKPAPKPTVT